SSGRSARAGGPASSSCRPGAPRVPRRHPRSAPRHPQAPAPRRRPGVSSGASEEPAGEPRLAAREQAADVVAMQREDAEGGDRGEAHHGPRGVEGEAGEGERDRGDDRRERRVAGRREHDEPHNEARGPESGASSRATPAAVATILPPFENRRKTGRACPTIAAAPARTPTQSPPTCSPRSAGTSPLATSRSATGTPSEGPYARHTFDAPTLPLPARRTSSPPG